MFIISVKIPTLGPGVIGGGKYNKIWVITKIVNQFVFRDRNCAEHSVIFRKRKSRPPLPNLFSSFFSFSQIIAIFRIICVLIKSCTHLMWPITLQFDFNLFLATSTIKSYSSMLQDVPIIRRFS
jgi:hypothetical protein